MKALHVVTVQGDPYRRHDDPEFAVGDQIINTAAIKRAHATLEAYISIKTVNKFLFQERYYFFDHEKFKTDLEKFGVEIPE